MRFESPCGMGGCKLSRRHSPARRRFIRALRAEGVPCSAGYPVLTRQPFLEQALQSRAYQKVYPPERLRACRESAHCPQNELLCGEVERLVLHGRRIGTRGR